MITEQMKSSNDTFDLEEFRRNTAKDILIAMMHGGWSRNEADYKAEIAVKFADSLIKALKIEK